MRPLRRRVKRGARRERYPAARSPLRRIGTRLGEASSGRPMLRSREHFLVVGRAFGPATKRWWLWGLLFVSPLTFGARWERPPRLTAGEGRIALAIGVWGRARPTVVEFSFK